MDGWVGVCPYRLEVHTDLVAINNYGGEGDNHKRYAAISTVMKPC